MIFHLVSHKSPIPKAYSVEVKLPRGAASNAEIICNAAEEGCGTREPGCSGAAGFPLIAGACWHHTPVSQSSSAVLSHISHPLATAECFGSKHLISLVDLDKQAS